MKVGAGMENKKRMAERRRGGLFLRRMVTSGRMRPPILPILWIARSPLLIFCLPPKNS